MTDELETELRSIALHESGHVITAFGVGGGVRRVRLRAAGDAVVGLTFPIWSSRTTRVERIATFLGGSFATASAGELVLPSFGGGDWAATTPRRPVSPQLRRVIRTFRFDRLAQDDRSLNGDLAVVGALLSGLEPALQKRLFARADRLCRRILSTNDRLVKKLASRLLVYGDLNGSQLPEIREQTVQIDPTTLEMVRHA